MAYTPENNPYIPGDPYSYDLKWIVDKLKEAINLYQPLNDKFDTLDDSFDDLKTFVDNYFATLDVTEEIQSIIDQLKTDGYFNELINTILIDEGAAQDIITNWLTANVTPVGSAVIVDNSLTIAGAAADAKATGDNITDINTTINSLYNGVLYNTAISPLNKLFIRGLLNGNTGLINTAATYRITTQAIQYAEDDIRITPKEGFRIYVCWYSADGIYSEGSYSGWINENIGYAINKGTYYRLQIARMTTTESTTEVADINEFIAGVNIVTNMELDSTILNHINGVVANSASIYSFASSASSVRFFLHNVELKEGDYAISYYLDTNLTSAERLNLFYAISPESSSRIYESHSNLTKGYHFWQTHIATGTYDFGIWSVNLSDDITVKDFAVIDLGSPTYNTRNYDPYYSGFVPIKHSIYYENRYNARMGQGIAVYNNTLFAIYNRTDGQGITAYDMNSTESDGSLSIINRDLSIPIGHGNGLQFGQILDGDFPHLYVSGWDNNTVYEYSFINNVFTLVNTYSLPSNLHYTTVAVNELEHVFYIFNCDVYPEVLYNYDFIVYDYQNQQIIKQRKTEAFMTMQDCEFTNGCIMVVSGYGTGSNPSKCYIYDLNGNRIGNIKLDLLLATTEVEGISFDPITNELYIGQAYYMYRVRA